MRQTITLKQYNKPEETFDIEGFGCSGDFLILDISGNELVSGKEYVDMRVIKLNTIELFRRYPC